jgi:23S rRNA A1618 N6-methylase RlmF
VFVLCMIIDSLMLGDRMKWYTSLLGKKSSVKLLLRVLRHESIVNVRTVAIQQGRTRRWILAWSFCSPDDVITDKVGHTLYRSSTVVTE